LQPTSLFNLSIDAENEKQLALLESLRSELEAARSDVFKDETAVSSLNSRIDSGT